jgi:hypothetical protein
MAQKDADMASDYGDRFLHLYKSNNARHEPVFSVINDPATDFQELILLEVVPGGSGGAGKTYRMRGFDTNGAVNSTVYWNSTTIDADAADYTGSAGPVINIVVNDVIGD